MPEPARTLLGLDFGVRCIGVALGNSLTNRARALTVIDTVVTDQRFAQLAALIAQWQPDGLVVGRPLNDDGSPTPTTARAERFANQLRGRFGLPVLAVDERFSSREAQAIIASGPRQRAGEPRGDDAVAAAVILQQALDAHTQWLAELPAARVPSRP
ncbi:MAG: Holliday junction resolvase RuvX [Burkholderiales bacterium]|jgi:putative Holliday junction resolvase